MRTHQLVLVLFLASLILATAVGCSKVSKANFDKIKTDMTLADVEKILGKGEEVSGGASVAGITLSGKQVEWKSGGKSITVTFVNDKVTLKQQTGL